MSMKKRASNTTINEMIGCLFEGVKLPEWDDIYLEYIDISGMAATKEYELIKTIHNLENRALVIPQIVAVIKECLLELGELPPHPVARLRKFGHRLPETDIFQFLETIPRREMRYTHDLVAARAELEKIQGAKMSGTDDEKKQRYRFIRMLNNLGTIYKIDREKTMVEELALMVKEQEEQRRESELEKLFKGK